MFTMPDRKGNKTVMLLVKRSDKPLVMDAFSNALVQSQPMAKEFQDTNPGPTAAPIKSSPNAAPAMQDVVNAVLAAMNMSVNQGVNQSAARTQRAHGQCACGQHIAPSGYFAVLSRCL